MPTRGEATADERRRRLRVMTYNLQYADALEPVGPWSTRRAMIGALMRGLDLDLVCAQEALDGQVHDLERELGPDYGWVGVGRDDGGRAGEYVPIFFRSARLEILQNKTIWLSETPAIPSRGWDARQARIASLARLRDRYGGRELVVVNTHFDHRGPIARVESARLVLELLRQQPRDVPALVVGDLNTEPNSAPVEMLCQGEPPLRDTYHATRHEGPGWTSFHRERRIDYILASPEIIVHRHATFPESPSAPHPRSDHLPVVAEIELP